MSYKLGSLFDGSGGFPLAGALCGIEPSWASEVEPYPIAVTSERFLNMKHLGDISKINGAEVEPVDIITFGSPCQDLSVAGKRAGLKHEANGDEETTRSGLFMEAVRIIKEMRRATNGKYPSFALWENVPGAFSSNKGEDFRIVLEELIKIVEPSAFMPPVPKNGWPYADSYVGDEWSLAYRVFDAQYWGVPQRRRRIHLVLDLRGERAREVLFEREGVRGYFTQSGKAWEGTPDNAEGSTGTNDREGADPSTVALAPVASTLRAGAGAPKHEQDFVGRLVLEQKEAVGINGDIAGTLDASYYKGCGMRQGVEREVVAEPIGFDAYNQTLDNFVLFEPRSQDGVNEDVAFTCNTIDRHAAAYAVVGESIVCSGTFLAETGGNDPSRSIAFSEELSATLRAGFVPAAVYRQGGFADYVEGEVGTLRAAGGDFGGGSENLICERKPQYIVRRLTPTECARLQGFADDWGYIEEKDTLTDEEYSFWLEVRNTHAAINGKPVKEYTVKQMLTWYNKLYTDSAEYKMWGNGIALPPALYCMQGITDALNAYANVGEGDHPLTQEKIDAAMLKAYDVIQEDEATETEETIVERLVLDDQGGQQITVREDGKAPTLRAEMHGNVPCVLVAVDTAEAEEVEGTLTDFSDAPEEIKEEIMENAEKLAMMNDPKKEEKMPEINTEPPARNEEPPAAFNAIEQLRALAEERKVLAHINANTPRFSDDVRAIEYAVSVLEAVGL